MSELVALLVVVGVILGVSLIGATILQQRRLLRTRQHLGGRLLAAQDEERAAIARELHDDAVQQLLSLAATLRTASPEQMVPVANHLERLADELRGLARGMHPSVVDILGLPEALAELAAGFEEREGIRVELATEIPPEMLAPTERLALYRVAQEALSNAARHAGVATVQLRLEHRGRQVRLTVEDLGRGFSPEEIAQGPGIGITSMRERLEILGGTLECVSSRGYGTRITAELTARGNP